MLTIAASANLTDEQTMKMVTAHTYAHHSNIQHDFKSTFFADGESVADFDNRTMSAAAKAGRRASSN